MIFAGTTYSYKRTINELFPPAKDSLANINALATAQALFSVQEEGKNSDIVVQSYKIILVL